MNKTCAHCGGDTNPKRMYCSSDCHQDAIRQQRQNQLDEFKWIAGTDTWDNIATRLGYSTTDSLARFLQRCGESEWARRVERVRYPHIQQKAA